MKMIFHLVERAEWERAVAAGEYAPESLRSDGFIHCSTLAQLVATANAWFRGRRGLVVLCIEESRLDAPLRLERPIGHGDPRAREAFPHLYGALKLDAVIEVVAFPCDSAGEFMLPHDLRSYR
jgi:uncharacterized protein (DUF952 family)